VADLPDTICFKCSRWMADGIAEQAIEERRTLAGIVRVLVEEALAARWSLGKNEVRIMVDSYQQRGGKPQ